MAPLEGSAPIGRHRLSPKGKGGPGALLRNNLTCRCKLVSFEAILRLDNYFYSNTLVLKIWGEIFGWDLPTLGACVCPKAILITT